MRLNRVLPLVVIALAGLTLGAGCPTIPSIQERTVELAVGGTTTLDFTAAGATNVWSGNGVYDLANDIDINELLDDAGIHVQDVKSITLSGVSYRVSEADPTPTRTITSGTVSAARGAGAPVALLTNFQQNAGTTTPFVTAPISSAGVAMINQLLSDILDAAKSGTPVPNSVITYSYNGDSTPIGVQTSFKWQLKLDISIVGDVKIDVLDAP